MIVTRLEIIFGILVLILAGLALYAYYRYDDFRYDDIFNGKWLALCLLSVISTAIIIFITFKELPETEIIDHQIESKTYELSLSNDKYFYIADDNQIKYWFKDDSLIKFDTLNLKDVSFDVCEDEPPYIEFRETYDVYKRAFYFDELVYTEERPSSSDIILHIPENVIPK